MIGEVEWFSSARKFGWIIGIDNIGQVARYFLPGAQIKFLKVQEPQPGHWVQFVPAPAKYGLPGGRVANPIAQCAGVYPSRVEAALADALIQVAVSSKGDGK